MALQASIKNVNTLIHQCNRNAISVSGGDSEPQTENTMLLPFTVVMSYSPIKVRIAPIYKDELSGRMGCFS